MRSSSRWFVVPLLVPALFGQTATKPHAKKALSKQPEKAVTAADVQALKDGLAAQQQQILQLQQALAQRDQGAQEAQQLAQQAQAAANDAQQKAAALATTAGSDKDTVTKLNSDFTDVKSTIQNQLVTVQDEQKRVSALEGALGASAGLATFACAEKASFRRASPIAIAPASVFGSASKES